jgi:hypothetical protein
MKNTTAGKCSLPEEDGFIFEKHRMYMNGFYLTGECSGGVLGGLSNLLTHTFVSGHFLHGIKKMCLYSVRV